MRELDLHDTYPGIYPDDEVDPTIYLEEVAATAVLGAKSVHREKLPQFSAISHRVATQSGAVVVYDSRGRAKVRPYTNESIQPIPLNIALNQANHESVARGQALKRFLNSRGQQRLTPVERGQGKGPRTRATFKKAQLAPQSFQSQANLNNIPVPPVEHRPRRGDLDNGDGVTWD